MSERPKSDPADVVRLADVALLVDGDLDAVACCFTEGKHPRGVALARRTLERVLAGGAGTRTR